MQGHIVLNVPDASTAYVVSDTVTELMSATAAHGPLKSLHEAYAVIKEELDEFWELVKQNPKKLSPLEQALRRDNIQKELTQVAAMAMRAAIDLGGKDV